MSELYKRKPNTACFICGKAVYKRPGEIKENDGRVFCSQICFGKSCRKEVSCLMCGKLILAGLNKKTCSRACSNKYRQGIKYKIGRPRDKAKTAYLLKLRIIDLRGSVCERCGYSKTEILQIHHKDRNRENNSLNNLELICPNCHYEEHYSQHSEKWSEAQSSWKNRYI